MTIAFIAGEPIDIPDWEDGHFDILKEYWRDPKPFLEEEARRKAMFEAAMAPHDARVRAEQEARWAREEAEEAEANSSTRSAWGMA